ncbi:MAG: hypothetical protein WAU49_15300 [Steroidobacteraceae bacterium]
MQRDACCDCEIERTRQVTGALLAQDPVSDVVQQRRENRIISPDGPAGQRRDDRGRRLRMLLQRFQVPLQ